MTHEMYVWQRQWTEAVSDGVRLAPSQGADGFAVLAAQVSWRDGVPAVIVVAPDYRALRESSRPVGLVLRINEYAGDLERDPSAAELVAGTARRVADEALASGVTPAEIQIDYDCAESRLQSYGPLVDSVKRSVAGIPVVVTALPCWLRQASAFRRLVTRADGFVLQVHSLRKPAPGEAGLRLCDAAPSAAWIREADCAGVPFRVALPTYSYALATPGGEEPRTVLAVSDPGEICTLLEELRSDPPANLRGVIWFRMPTSEDTLNWTWPTLSAVIAGRRPESRLSVQVRRPEPGLADVEAMNEGDADAPSGGAIRIGWTGARLVAMDALSGYAVQSQSDRDVVLRWRPDEAKPPIVPAERRPVAWLRFDRPTEVSANVLAE